MVVPIANVLLPALFVLVHGRMRELLAEQAGRIELRFLVRITREQKLVVVPFMMKLTYWQHAVFPALVQSLRTRTGYKRSRGAARGG